MSRAGSATPASEYESILSRTNPGLFGAIPKSVWASIALSLAGLCMDSGCDGPMEDRAERIIEEWAALHASGIVPQKPPRGVKHGR